MYVCIDHVLLALVWIQYLYFLTLLCNCCHIAYPDAATNLQYPASEHPFQLDHISDTCIRIFKLTNEYLLDITWPSTTVLCISPLRKYFLHLVLDIPSISILNYILYILVNICMYIYIYHIIVFFQMYSIVLTCFRGRTKIIIIIIMFTVKTLHDPSSVPAAPFT